MSYDEPAQAMPDMPDREYAARVRDRDVEAKLRQRSDRAPIEAALDRCDEQTQRVAELVENLGHRLAPVLGPDRPEPALGQVRSSEDSSSLANRLDLLAERLEEACGALLRTTRRLEL